MEKTERALRETEKSYAALFKNMLNGFALHEIVTDDEGSPVDYVFREVNSAFESITMLNAEEIVGKSVTEVFPGTGDQPADWIGQFGKVAMEGEDLRCEFYAESLDRWFSIYAYSPGERFFATIFEDITERRQSEEALREREERYRMVSDFTFDWEEWALPDGSLRYVSPSCERVTGYRPEEFMRDPGLRLRIILPDDREMMRAHFDEVGRVYSNAALEFRVESKDGRIRHIEHMCTPVAGRAGEYCGRRASNRDVTEVKAAKQALVESELKYRELFENMQEGVALCKMLFDEDGLPADFVYLDTNKAFGSSTGLSDVIGKKVSEVIPGIRETNPEVLEILGRVEQTGEPEQFEIRLDALSIDLSVKAFSATKEHFVTVFENISERIRAQKKLRRINEELKAYTHSVSHDLKGPIGTIGLAADMLSEMGARVSFEDAAKAAKELKKTAGVAQERIEQLLMLAESGQVPEKVEDLDVAEVVGEVLREMSPSIKARNVEVSADEEMGHLLASREQVRQVFSNLISNAVKHNDSGTPRISVSYLGLEAGGIHRYLVRDNGSGIRPKELEKIFLPFQKGSKTGESGIGLTIAKKIIEAYGGDVTAYNDDGACFEVTFANFSYLE